MSVHLESQSVEHLDTTHSGSGGSLRAAVYLCGVRDERPVAMEAVQERTVKWGEDQGYEIVETFEDDLVNWSAKHREELSGALELLAKGEADVLVIPLEAYTQLCVADQKWLTAACEGYGGRVVTVPTKPAAGLTL